MVSFNSEVLVTVTKGYCLRIYDIDSLDMNSLSHLYYGYLTRIDLLSYWYMLGLHDSINSICTAHSKNCWVHHITLWLFNIAMENGPFIDDFPSYKPPFIVDSPWMVPLTSRCLAPRRAVETPHWIQGFEALSLLYLKASPMKTNQ